MTKVGLFFLSLPPNLANCNDTIKLNTILGVFVAAAPGDFIELNYSSILLAPYICLQQHQQQHQQQLIPSPATC